ncbi:MAG: SRPBCC domain-containing protein, partial [Chloroflexota bacterium]|nr:SRPBCC domain-containing protein [Chloroflexota bacterium]
MTHPIDVTTPSDREIRVTRVFDAPRSLIFDCHTKPDLVRRWLLGPPGWSMPVCEIDLRVGGQYRYVWRNDVDGREFSIGGEYREVVPPERIVHTERYEGDEGGEGGEALSTLTGRAAVAGIRRLPHAGQAPSASSPLCLLFALATQRGAESMVCRRMRL